MYKIVRAEYVWRMASMAFEIVGEPHARSSLVCWASRCPIKSPKAPQLRHATPKYDQARKENRRVEQDHIKYIEYIYMIIYVIICVI